MGIAPPVISVVITNERRKFMKLARRTIIIAYDDRLE